MKDNIMIDSSELYENREKKIPRNDPYHVDSRTLQVQIRKMKALGRGFDEIARELNLKKSEVEKIYG
jgi:hypothetical protein